MKIAAILKLAIASTILLALGISIFLIVLFNFHTIDKPDFSVTKYSPLFVLESNTMDTETKNISYHTPCCTIV
ncbi:MAG: hypothetical protein WB511_13540 [Nitrososphaeraceae archaeon]